MTNARSAVEALQVLQLLGRRAEPVAAAAVARELGLPRSTTYHLLSALRDAGFVSHLPDERRWGLGVAAFELGSAYSRQAPLQRIARPPMIRLVEQTRHSAHLVILHGRDVLYVIEERAPGRASLVTDVGVRMPATVTASGLAVLAALPPQQVRALFPGRDDFVQRHGRGPTSLTGLRSLLTQVRRQGFAQEIDSVTPGFGSVAAAVADHVGHPAAGIALTYPRADVDDDEHARLVAAVRRTAADLSRRLGHRP